MSYIMAGCAIAFFVFIAFIWKHPVLFMFAGGFSIIAACYMADILSGGITSNLSITASLSMIGLSLTCIAFAFGMMFAEGKS